MVTGLTNGKTYTCTVLATNSVGDSDASVASDADRARPRCRHAGRADVDARQRVDLGGVRRAGQQRRRAITGYTATLHVE